MESFLLYVGMKLWRYQLRLHLYWTRAWVLTAFWTMLGRGTR